MSDSTMTPPDDLEHALQKLVAKHAEAFDLQEVELLENYRLRVDTLRAIKTQCESDLKARNLDLASSVAREKAAFEENERLGAALATVKKLLELIAGIRDPEDQREAQLTLVTRFITDALNPIPDDDTSDIPF